MHHDFPLLLNITIALVVAFAGGLIARRLKFPTIVGYLVAGVIIGPFTPGFVGDINTIQELAEIGVIFLLFGVGLHFSLRDLWAVRDIAIAGSIAQMAMTTLVTALLTQLWGWSLQAGILLGLAVSIASTVVLLRNLMDNGLLNTSHGQVAVGWLVLEDLATVLILVVLPAFSTNSSQPLWQTAGLALLKAAAFAVLMLVAGKRVIPWLLMRIAHIRSRELFIVAIVVITLGTAVAAASFFGVSLALGAFLAGVVVNESSLSHQVEAEILPFRETFAVLFFVSVGMLVNPLLLITQPWSVLALITLIVLGKILIVLLLGLFFSRSARTILIVAIALSQIGEFSFLLGQEGMQLGILTQDQYGLLLMGALLSITINPFLFRLLPWLETQLRRRHTLWALLDRHTPKTEPSTLARIKQHVVVIGYGRIGQQIVSILRQLDVPILVIELDAERVNQLQHQGIPTLYGDAANSDILLHAHLDEARAVVVTVPKETTAMNSAASLHNLAPDLPLLVRAATSNGVSQLLKMGATFVVYPELEGGLEMLNQLLIRLDFSEKEVHAYVNNTRLDFYGHSLSTNDAAQSYKQDNHLR